MVRFILLLLGARLRLFYNTFSRGKPAAKIGWIVAGVALLAAGAFSALGGYGLARLLIFLQQPEFRADMLQAGLPLVLLEPEVLVGSLLSLIVLAVWGMVLLSSLSAALSNFYLASDLELLIAAPIPMRAIFVAKFLEGLAVGYLLLFFLAGPALFGLGLGLGYAAPYFVGVVLVLILLPLLPESLGTLLVMPLVRIIPPKRLREAMQVVGALVGAAFYFFSQVQGGGDIDPQTAGTLVQWLNRLHLPYLPHGWAAQGLVALGGGRYLEALAALGAFLLLSAGAFVLGLLTSERLYYSGWARMQAEPAGRRRRAAVRARPAGEVPLLPRPTLGILAKDLRLFVREPQGWSQMLMPLAVYALLIFQSARGNTSATAASAVSLGSGLLVLFLSASMLSRLALGGIGSEGKQFWLLKTAPIDPRHLLWAKFLATYLPLLPLSGAMLLAPALIGGAPDWGLYFGNWLLVALIGMGLSGISVGLGAAFPRMEAEKGRQTVSAGAGCLYLPIIGTYTVLVAGLLFLTAFLHSLLLELGLPGAAWALWAGGAVGATGLSALALWLPLRLGAARLSRLEA